MDVRILGPFEVRESGRPLALGRGKQTALLARLVLDANRVVSVDVLIDDLWGEDPPETAVKMVQVYVSKLRKLLPAETLRTRAPGYLLELPPGAVDLERFEALLAEGRSSLAAGRADETSALLREALALWRSPALAEFEEPFALSRRHVWASCGYPRSRSGSTPISRSAATPSSRASSRRSLLAIRSANGCAVSTCSPSTASDARPTPSPPIRRFACASPRSWGSSPRAGSGSSSGGSCGRTATSRPSEESSRRPPPQARPSPSAPGPLRDQRRGQHRLPGRRRRAARPRARARLGVPVPARLGVPDGSRPSTGALPRWAG